MDKGLKGSLVDCTGASVGDKCPSSCSLPVKFQVLSLNILGFPSVNTEEGKLDMWSFFHNLKLCFILYKLNLIRFPG